VNLNSFLSDLGLTDLLPLFADAGVDFDVLERLTDTDLKELGIAQLGARRKILYALEKTIPINRMDLIAQLEEQETYRQEISGKQVVVSSYRLVVGDESILMNSVKSASVYTHVEPDLSAEQDLMRSKSKANIRLVGGLCVLVLRLAAFLLISELYQLLLLALFGTAPGLALLISGLRRLRTLADREIRPLQSYYLRIETNSGPNDILLSVDKKELDQIVQAISKAQG